MVVIFFLDIFRSLSLIRVVWSGCHTKHAHKVGYNETQHTRVFSESDLRREAAARQLLQMRRIMAQKVWLREQNARFYGILGVCVLYAKLCFI